MEMKDPQGAPVDEDHQDLEGPPGPVRPIIVQQPQVVLDTTSLENTFDTMGQSMLQLARVQDQNKSSFTTTYTARTTQCASPCWCFATTG